MTKHHPKNERMKRKYFIWLEDAKQLDPKSVDQIAAAISLFEKSTGYKDFASFHIEQARKFKRDLKEAKHHKTGKPLAVATRRSRLLNVKDLFKWLADQLGYKSRITHADCEYFNPSANETRIATARRERPVPTLQQVHSAIAAAPHGTDLEKRDRALIAFTLLSGMRDAAIASLTLGKIDLADRKVYQDARDVDTKNAKTMTTNFFPVGGEAEMIVTEWINYLRQDLLFAETDPVFPKPDMGLRDGKFAAMGISRRPWKNAAAIRRIFKERFKAAGLPYYHPHSFRKTLGRHGERICKTPEEFKAWSQNLGHENVLTTFTNYGKVAPPRPVSYTHLTLPTILLV